MRWREKVTDVLNQYKRKNLADMLILIPVLDDKKQTIAFLRPITADYQQTIPECVSLFSRWRMENPTLSLARFDITDERTKSWLDRLVVQNDNRIIFLITNYNGEALGHIGFANFREEEKAAEVDSVLRGQKNGYPRLMEYAMAALISWGKQELELQAVDLEVWSKNEHAIRFYKRCGFVEERLIPLRRVEEIGEVKWVPDESMADGAENYYLHMVFQGDDSR